MSDPVTTLATTPVATVKSAMRTLDIIELVVAHPGGMVAQDIARALAIPVSSLSYLLGTLVEREYLRREGRAYFPGDGLDRLHRPRAERSLAEQVRPLVHSLRIATGETASFFVRDGWDLVALATESSEHTLRYSIAVGSRTPLHCVAAGKAILAALDDAELARFFAEVPLTPYTPRSIVSSADLRRAIDAIRVGGLATTDGEYTPGIRGLGMAALRDGAVLGAFGVAVPDARFDPAVASRASEALQQAVAALVPA